MMLGVGEYEIPKGKLSVVVTYLEMTAPQPVRAAPAIKGFSMRRVTNPDVAWYRDLFRRVGALEWLWHSRLDLDDTELDAILIDPAVHVYAAQLDGQDEGIVELDFRTQGLCELAFFGTTRSLMGKGAGRAMMNHAITAAWAEPIRLLHVHTCTADHPAALAFYQRSGFVPVRQTIDIEEDPRLTGMVPRDSGPHVPIFD
jgi:GNAT superfamily N-acetyltransferase